MTIVPIKFDEFLLHETTFEDVFVVGYREIVVDGVTVKEEVRFRIHDQHSDDETASSIMGKIGNGAVIDNSYLPAAVYSDFIKVKFWQDALPGAGMVDADICYQPTTKILNCYVAGIGWVEVTKRTDTMYIVMNSGLANHLFKYIWDSDMINITQAEMASQAEAEAGTSSKIMNALRVVQSIAYQLINLDFAGLTTTSKKIVGSINELNSGKQANLTFTTDIETDKASTTKVAAIKPWYDWISSVFVTSNISEVNAAAGAATYTLLKDKELSILNALPAALATFALPAFVDGQKNESCVSFTTGGTIPTLAFSGFTPRWESGIALGALTLNVNKAYEIVFKQVKTVTGTVIVKAYWGEE